MALYMYQFAYTPESRAAQIKNPQNRIEQVGRAATEAAGGKFIGGWLCMGEFDAVLIADVPNIESMAALALAVAAGGALKSGTGRVDIVGAGSRGSSGAGVDRIIL